MKLLKTSALLLILTLSGCATSGLEVVGQPNAENDKKALIIHNQSLANIITIDSMKSRERGGLLQVNVTLKNLANSTNRMQYKFSWFDAEGFEVEPEASAWTPITLHGAASVTLDDSAPNSSVKSYKINVREQ